MSSLSDARRLAQLVAEENEPGLYYMSFCDPNRPKGTQWLGASIVEANGVVSAARIAHVLGCNPGGEIATWGPIPIESIKPDYLNRLLTKDEVDEVGK